jgi:hypothetical protein
MKAMDFVVNPISSGNSYPIDKNKDILNIKKITKAIMCTEARYKREYPSRFMSDFV